MNVELEHGKSHGKSIPKVTNVQDDERAQCVGAPTSTNVTDDDLFATAQIVIAHLLEFPDYYRRLKRMESSADKYWQ